MSIAERRLQGTGLEAAVESLALESKKAPKKAKKPVADSWEDEEISSDGSDTETEGPSLKPSVPGPPPPTPVTPNYKKSQTEAEFDDPYAVKEAGPGKGPRTVSDGRRPEKQTATASRLIAGALGVKAPKRTEEQRAYDRAVREKEQRKKDQDRTAQKKVDLDREKAKAAVWDS